MKKRILSIIMVCVLMFSTVATINVFAATHTLGEIVEKFNSSSVVANYASMLGCTYTASISEEDSNILVITTSKDGEDSTVSYVLDGSILSCDQIAESDAATVPFLADSVGQVNGYADGELLNNFNLFGDRLSEYSVENEGFELKEEGDHYSVKMDIDKKVPLFDESEFYLTPSDFDKIAEFVAEGAEGNQSGKKGRFAYDLSVNNEKNEIFIGEDGEITDGTYKSILSAIEVMYGPDVVEWFKYIYPSFEKGTVVLDGIEIYYDAELDTEEHPMYDGKKVVKVVLDNKFINQKFFRTEYIGEKVDCGEKTITLDFMANKSYKLNATSSVKESDVAFLIKYVLTPIFDEANATPDGDTIYFDVKDGKIVVGDKEHSIIKVVAGDEDFEILPTKSADAKTTVTAKHDDVEVKMYRDGAESEDEFRYELYDITVNFVFGKDGGSTEVPTEAASKTVDKPVGGNPQTGDNIALVITFLVIAILSAATILVVRKKTKKQ